MIKVKKSAELINPISYDEALNTVEQAARNCYQSGDKISDGSAEKIVRFLIKNGHLTPIEFAGVTIKLVIDRACYDDKTEVLTKKGWKFFHELDDNDVVATLNQKTKKVEFKKPHEYISYFYSGDMVRIKTKNTDLLVTPNHNIWAKKTDLRTKEYFSFHRADSLKNKYILDKMFDYDNPECSDEVVIHGFSYSYKASNGKKEFIRTDVIPDIVFSKQDFVKFMAFYLSEGSVRKCGINAYQIIISQKECENNVFTRKLIVDTLSSMGIKATVDKCGIRFKHKQLGKFLMNLGTAIHKYFPFDIFDFFNKYYAKLFIDTYILFDGSRDDYGYGKLYTSSARLRNDLECISIVAGLSFHTHTRNEDLVGKQIMICGSKATVNAPCYNINLTNKYNKNPYIQVKKSVSTTQYTGYVYCVNVENHIIYVRRNGVSVWCGNCMAQLTRHRLATFCIESTRYCNYNKSGEIKVIVPEGLNNHAYATWHTSMLMAETSYMKMIQEDKVSAEVARSVLPQSLATTVFMHVNFRELRHILTLRLDSHAQRDIRVVMYDLLELVYGMYPVFFEDIYKEYGEYSD